MAQDRQRIALHRDWLGMGLYGRSFLSLHHPMTGATYHRTAPYHQLTDSYDHCVSVSSTIIALHNVTHPGMDGVRLAMVGS